ncbi:MAG: hypothetical protein QXY22_02595 [Candidatus Nitrosotenuis sp.]
MPLILLPIYGQPLSDRTGMKTTFEVTVDGKKYPLEIVGNFDVKSVDLQGNNLEIEIYSSLSNNLGEMQIPLNVTREPIQFFIDEQEFFPKVLKNDKIHFVTLQFAGNGTHRLVITGAPEPSVQMEEKIVNGQIPYLPIVLAVIAAITVGTILVYRKRKQKSS